MGEGQIAEDWIEHDGGPMPVDGDQVVSIEYRGAEAPELMGQRIPFARASRMDWSHDGGPDDIIAYRKEPTP